MKPWRRSPPRAKSDSASSFPKYKRSRVTHGSCCCGVSCLVLRPLAILSLPDTFGLSCDCRMDRGDGHKSLSSGRISHPCAPSGSLQTYSALRSLCVNWFTQDRANRKCATQNRIFAIQANTGSAARPVQLRPAIFLWALH